ncbi:Acyl-CoA dehydrogenase fadE12 [Streptomyces tendae]
MAASAKPPAFDPADPLGLDDLLEPEDLAIRDTVRGWAADRVLPYVADWYEKGELPGIRELARELGGIGALGMSLDGYGCAGASAVQYGLACLELEAADSGIRSLVSVQGSLAMYAIHRFGSEEQKQRWLPRMAAGEVIGCFGLTEPDHGSDPASMRTYAKRDGSDWVLNGRKMDHQRVRGRGRGRLGADRRRHPRLRRAHRRPRFLGAADQAQVVAARLRHQRARDGRRPAARRRPAAGGRAVSRPSPGPERPC